MTYRRLFDPRYKTWVAAGVLGILWFGSVMAIQLGRGPHIDEGYYSFPARNLLLHGSWDSREIESSGFVLIDHDSPLTGVDRHTYYHMPLFPLVATVFFRLFGFGVLPFRMVSLLFGAIGLVLWFLLIRLWSGRRDVAWAATIFIAFDWAYLSANAVARPDIMVHTLGLLALYTHERYYPSAPVRTCLIASTCLITAFLAHPYAGIWGILYLIRFATQWKNWTFAQFAALSAPGLVALLCVAIWASQDWPAFQAQITANSSFRGTKWSWDLPLKELLRYRRVYGISGESPQPQLILAAKTYSVMPWLIALPLLAFHRRWRQTPGLLRCVLMGVTAMAVLTWDASRGPVYALHTIPWLAVIGAFGLVVALERGVPKPLVLGFVALYVLTASALSAGLGWRNLWAKETAPAVASLSAVHAGDEVVFAPPEFRLVYGGPMMYDIRLGYRSGRRPKGMALRRQDIDEVTRWAKDHDPVLLAHYSALLAGCSLKYENNQYLVYDCSTQPLTNNVIR